MYEFTDEMDEISGMGGGYEDCCRLMLKSGLEWLEANPNASPEFQGYENIYGIIKDNNEDAEGLTEAIVSGAPDRDCTGAMHQAVVTSCMWIKKKGWGTYVEEMSKPDEEIGCNPKHAGE